MKFLKTFEEFISESKDYKIRQRRKKKIENIKERMNNDITDTE